MVAKKTDINQKQIVTQLRAIGCSVFVLSAVGKGFCDIIVGYKGKNILVEIKNPDRKWSYTPDQIKFNQSWRGQRTTITSVAELYPVLGVKE